jgi:hypothetical protein
MVIAQQLIDATTDGGLAFVAFTVMVVLMAASLFFMDRVRSKKEREAERERRGGDSG